MSCQTKTTSINGHEYAYTQLPATSSLKLKYKLGKIIGSSFGDLIGAIGKGEKEQVKAFSDSIENLLMKNDTDEIVGIIISTMKPVFRDNERIGEGFDLAYTNNFGEMYSAFAWVLSCEYGDFIKGLGKLV